MKKKALETRAQRRVSLSAILAPILRDERLEDPRWRSLSVIFSVSGRGRNCGNSGYAYGSDGDWWTLRFPVIDTAPPVLAFARAVHGRELPEALFRVLLQFDRDSRQGRLQIELEEPERWRITPETALGQKAAIQPMFRSESGACA